MSKVNLPTLAYNAARAKQRLNRQEIKLNKLTRQLIDRVGTGGQSFSTNLGMIVVTSQTEDRFDTGFILSFDEAKFYQLTPEKQAEITNLGIVHVNRKLIKGQEPKVQFRLTEKQ